MPPIDANSLTRIKANQTIAAQRLNEALGASSEGGNTVTRTEWDQFTAPLLDRTGTAWMTQSAKRQLRDTCYANAGEFEAPEVMRTFWDDVGAGVVPDTLVSTGGQGGPVKDPDILTEDINKVTYQTVDGSVVLGDINGDDSQQGQIGDCFEAASESEAALKGAIADALTEQPDGTKLTLLELNSRYHQIATAAPGAVDLPKLYCRFFQRQYDGNFKKVFIPYDADFPTLNGGLRYAHARDPGELWPAIVEKCYADFVDQSNGTHGGYNSIGKGGSPGEAMEALFGRPARYVPITPRTTAAQVASVMNQIKQKNLAFCLVTYPEDSKVDSESHRIYKDHTYAGWVSRTNSPDQVSERNPWGEVEYGNDGKNDGIFDIPIADFVQYTSGIYVC